MTFQTLKEIAGGPPGPRGLSSTECRPWKERPGRLEQYFMGPTHRCSWADIPDRYPSYQTCHRRFQQWVRTGVMRGILEALPADLKIRRLLDVKKPSSMAALPDKKRDSKIGKTKRGKGSKIMAVADRHGFPVAVCVESARPHEVRLATNTLVRMVVPDAPQNLIGDNAYDSDKLDAELREYGIELIAPHRINRKNTTQDLGRLLGYRRSWKLERLFAWLQNFRSLVVRYERYGIEECFTINRLKVSPSLHRCLATRNFIESSQSGVRMRTRRGLSLASRYAGPLGSRSFPSHRKRTFVALWAIEIFGC